METFSNQKSRMSVSEVVKCAGLTDRGSYCRKPYSLPEVAATESASIWSGEEEAVPSWWALLYVLGEVGDYEAGECQPSATPCRLGWAEDQVTAELVQ
jgi:hypothetical protein